MTSNFVLTLFCIEWARVHDCTIENKWKQLCTDCVNATCEYVKTFTATKDEPHICTHIYQNRNKPIASLPTCYMQLFLLMLHLIKSY